MRLKLAFAAALGAAIPSVAAGQDSELTVGPAPQWAQLSEALPVPDGQTGIMFVRRQDVEVNLDADGQSTFIATRTRILQPAALEIGNILIAWNPAAGSPVVHAVKVHRDGAERDVLSESKFEILRREEQLEASVLSGQLTAILRVPDLRVGDELEMAYTLRDQDPVFGAESFGVLALGEAPPPGRMHIALSWSEGQAPQIKIPSGLEPFASRSANRLDIRADNAPIQTAPKDSPPRYSWHRAAQFSDFKSWDAISRRMETLFTTAAKIDKDSSVVQEAARIMAAHGDELARANAALDLVQQQVRYIYVGLDGGNFRPASAEETWQRRYGDCKGKTVLLMALLDEMGISSEPVLVNNSALDDGFDTHLPNPGVFDHVLVRTRIDGKSYWLDGTLPDVSDAQSDPVVPYRWVLPLTKAGAPLEKINFKPFDLPQEMGIYEIDATAGFEEPARLVQTSVVRGIQALGQYLQFSSTTPEQLLTAYRNALVGSTQWNTVESVAYRFDRDTQASILTIAGTGAVEWEDYGSGSRSLSLPGGGFSPPNRRQRSADQDQEAPFYDEPRYSCYATTLRLPEGTDIQNWGFNTTFDTMMYGTVYYRMVERRDDMTIRMVRGSRTETPEISVAQANRDNGRLAKFDNSKSNVSYDPNETMAPWGMLQKVPATYEFDWTKADVPCLPKDVIAGK
ncbi:DUF3857 domain-containing transglutaminase family protein [Allopontixanthobacter sediminis]|uniref:DUF3857 domain-containing transglutaminase family protein n=1 Tax=Allopontixanthobacter sediminis TaxID=1689985 RepID=UPI001E5A58CE|nr:DUF3857 domain-containing protein [Allopontixanthobacter sediminis]